MLIWILERSSVICDINSGVMADGVWGAAAWGEGAGFDVGGLDWIVSTNIIFSLGMNINYFRTELINDLAYAALGIEAVLGTLSKRFKLHCGHGTWDSGAIINIPYISTIYDLNAIIIKKSLTA
jgi:hypothetical protein